MQLFGLINTLLANDRETANRHLSIQRYAIIPLSPNSGLIGWVPNHDTLHDLIKYALVHLCVVCVVCRVCVSCLE
jgi:FKBP12-rapamycin complex-associated protein